MYYNPLNKIKMHEVKEKERKKGKKGRKKEEKRGRTLLKNKATIKCGMVDGVRVTHGCLN